MSSLLIGILFSSSSFNLKCHLHSLFYTPEKRVCSFVSVFIQTSHYASGPQYYNHRSERLEYPSADTRDIINAAVRLLKTIWKSGVKYHKAGIMLTDFSDPSVTKLNLFSDSKPYKGSRLAP